MKMSRDKLHLLELSGFEREQLARIPDSYIVTCADRTSVSAAMVKEADVIIGRVPVEFLGYARKLRLLQLDCAGSEQYTADGLLAKDCQLCNASGSFGLAISEYLICTILMLMRNMNLYIRNQEQAYWHMEGPVQSIYGSTVLIAGTGDLGQEFAKTAVGTSVFIMTFTAFTGAVSHFTIGGMPDMTALVLCIASTLLWARIAARFANKASAKTLNRATGVVLTVLGIAILAVNYL